VAETKNSLLQSWIQVLLPFVGSAPRMSTTSARDALPKKIALSFGDGASH
jgi:hypothetical protein